HKAIAPHFFDVALGTSPVLHNGRVLVVCDELQEKKSSRLLAFDGKTGELKWQRKRPQADWTHSTPALAKINGRTQLLVAGANALEGLDPASGEPVWRFTSPTRI